MDRSLVLAGAILASAAITPVIAMEQISMVYEKIEWNQAPTKAKLLADFRRMEGKLKVSPESTANAAQAAFNFGVEHQDSWNDQQIVLRGCGRQGRDASDQLCFVITCKRCTAK
jgi:hypothetical protein